MKVSIGALILCFAFVFSEGKVIKTLDIPIPPIDDGDYNIVSVVDSLFVAALDNGFIGDHGRTLGQVSMRTPDGTMPQKFRFQVNPYYDEQNVRARLYRIRTWGMFSFNVLQIELPAPNSYPVEANWEVEEVSMGQFLLRSHLSFDWGQRGEDFCLQTNGLNEDASIVKCDRTNPRHLWNLIKLDEENVGKSLTAPEPPIVNGNYFIRNVGDDKAQVAALDDGEGWKRVGPVTLNAPNPDAREQRWLITVRPFYEGETVRLFEFHSWGPNGFNVLAIELPRPGVYPVSAKWEIDEVHEGEYLLRSHLWFDWDERGEDFCLQSNGLDQDATIAQCDRTNKSQLWKFLQTE